jgi:hypothetical protein
MYGCSAAYLAGSGCIAGAICALLVLGCLEQILEGISKLGFSLDRDTAFELNNYIGRHF